MHPASERRMGYMKEADPEMRARLLAEIGYTEADLAENTERLKGWAKGQPHFPPSVKDEPDSFFQTYLLGCKGDTSQAKEKLDYYYSARLKLPKLHSDRDPKDLLSSRDVVHLGTLAQMAPDGGRINFGTLADYNPDNMDLLVIFKRFIATVEIRPRVEGVTGGDWGIIDCKCITTGHILKLQPFLIKDFLQLVQFIYPSRIRGIICINVLPFFETFLNTFVKPFLKKKLADRIFVYSEGGSALNNHLPKECIPKDLGGDADDVKTMSDYWLDEAVAWRDWFLGPLSETTDEAKRVGKDLNMEEIYGSFRKLEID